MSLVRALAEDSVNLSGLGCCVDCGGAAVRVCRWGLVALHFCGRCWRRHVHQEPHEAIAYHREIDDLATAIIVVLEEGA